MKTIEQRPALKVTGVITVYPDRTLYTPPGIDDDRQRRHYLGNGCYRITPQPITGLR